MITEAIVFHTTASEEKLAIFYSPKQENQFNFYIYIIIQNYINLFFLLRL